MLAASKDAVVLADVEMKVMKRLSGKVPARLTKLTLKDGNGLTVSLPVMHEGVYKTLEGYTVKVTPLLEEGIIKGYLVRFPGFETEPAAGSLPDRLIELGQSIGDIRERMTVFAELANRLSFAGSPPDAAELSREINRDIIKVITPTVNLALLTKLLSSQGGSGTVNAVECAENIAAYLKPIVSGGCSLTLNTAAGNALCQAKYEELETVLLNLIVNAAMYSGVPDRQITLSVGSDESGQFTEISVSDNGTSAQLEHIKSMTEIAGAREPKPDGTVPLGLVLARTFAEHYGGELLLEKSPTGGLTAVIRLPRAPGNGTLHFSVRRVPQGLMPFESRFCIISKAFDPFRDNDPF